jgi:hypothetical protein
MEAACQQVAMYINIAEIEFFKCKRSTVWSKRKELTKQKKAEHTCYSENAQKIWADFNSTGLLIPLSSKSISKFSAFGRKLVMKEY